MSRSVPVITVDGPSGSGKGTVSALVAEALGFHFLDSGAMYRIVGLIADRRGCDLDDNEQLSALVPTLNVKFDFLSDLDHSICVDGEPVGSDIRTETVAAFASQVATLPGVREALLELQRSFAQPPGLVADGRDMGTVIFPEADVKIFLTASAEERAERRYKQLIDKGVDVTFARLLEEIRARDEQDRNRKVAPLRPADDAVCVDTTGMNIERVRQEVMRIVQSRLG